jgi:hypothetical protein
LEPIRRGKPRHGRHATWSGLAWGKLTLASAQAGCRETILTERRGGAHLGHPCFDDLHAGPSRKVGSGGSFSEKVDIAVACIQSRRRTRNSDPSAPLRRCDRDLDENFSVDGGRIGAWASMKSFKAKDGSSEPPGSGRNGERDFHGEKRSNATHVSTTDPEAQLYRKGRGKEVSLRPGPPCHEVARG